MSYLPFAILSNLLNSISLTIDKFLLTKSIKDPLTYILYFSLMSIIIALFIPFINRPSSQVLLLASFSTIVWTAGAYAMFKAIQIGKVQRVAPVIGTLIPVFILFFDQSYNQIHANEKWAILLLLSGLILLNLNFLKGSISFSEILFEISASFLFALSYLLLKEAFLRADFLTVFVWSKPALIPVGVIIFLIPTLRRRALQFKKSKDAIPKKSLMLFILGQASGGLSELLLIFSISLASPAVVNSLQGTKYVFLLIFAVFLAKKYPAIFSEQSTQILNFLKLIGAIFIVFGLYLLSVTK